MGVCCESSGIGDPDMLIDLPRPSIEGIKDQYQRWEDGTPFKRTSFKAFKNAVNAAAKDCGGEEEGFVTIDSLANHLTTQAWRDIRNNGSNICKVLNSDAFKNPIKGQRAEQIDIKYLLMFALFHCRDVTTLENKCVGLYEILNDSMSRHTRISAADKDMKPTFEKICALATTELFDFVMIKGVTYT